MGSVHQVTLSNLFSNLLYAMRPSFLMCISSGSMFSIISRLICGVVLVRLAVRRQASLFKLFNFCWSNLVLILFPHVNYFDICVYLYLVKLTHKNVWNKLLF